MRVVSSGYLKVDWWLCMFCKKKMLEGDPMYIIRNDKGELKAACQKCAKQIDRDANPHNSRIGKW